MNINVTDQSRTEHVPVHFAPHVPTPAEIVELLRGLDNAAFRLTVRCAKRIRRADRIVATAEKEINVK